MAVKSASVGTGRNNWDSLSGWAGAGEDQILRALRVHNGPVPELPEVEALTTLLAERMAGQPIRRCELASFSALKTVSPSLDQLIGRVSAGCSRRGKYVCFDLDGVWLVAHLAPHHTDMPPPGDWWARGKRRHETGAESKWSVIKGVWGYGGMAVNIATAFKP